MTSKIIIIGLHHIKGIFWIFNISVLTLLILLGMLQII